MAANRCQNIRTGRFLFFIPSSLLNRDFPIRMQRVGHQDDPRRETKQTWGLAFNRYIRPLTLGLHAQVGTAFFKRPLDRPAQDEGFHDFHRRLCRIGSEGGSRFEFPGRIADQNPTDREWVQPGAVPSRRACSPLQRSPLTVVPFDCDGRPNGLRVDEDGASLR